jgi:hypothetical protein
MCDYSLHHVASRPARVSDQLITTKLSKTNTRAFAAIGEHGAKLVIHDGAPEVVVCLLPGTELAFEDDVRYDRPFFGKARVKHKVARFRQIDLDDPYVQHDALEFPDGQILKVACLTSGQTATVLQLPVAIQHPEHVETRHVARVSDSRVALDRRPARAGMASLLLPNQGSAMLWQALRSAAVGLSVALAGSFRRFKTQKRLRIATAALSAGFGAPNVQASFAALPPKKSAASEKKSDVKAAA